MNHAINQGWIMYWGTSRWSPVEIMEAYSNCRQFNCATPIIEQTEYHMFCRDKAELYMPELYNKIGEFSNVSWSALITSTLHLHRHLFTSILYYINTLLHRYLITSTVHYIDTSFASTLHLHRHFITSTLHHIDISFISTLHYIDTSFISTVHYIDTSLHRHLTTSILHLHRQFITSTYHLHRHFFGSKVSEVKQS